MATPQKTQSKPRSTSTPKSSASSKTKSTKGKGSKSGPSKGKILAATAGVAAAAAAGVAYYRGSRSNGTPADGDRSVYHVLPGSDGWQVKGQGAERAVSRHDTKKEAVGAARDLAHNQVPSQVIVHRSDGTVQESWSYDSD